MKLILYELNEVPWRVVDDYVATHPNSHWAKLVRDASTFTSLAPDRGELSPWVTWPTMHRGVPNTEHGIAFLGQDPDTYKYDPIWKVLKDHGKRIGIFGSLQSWPVPALKDDDFYVPDTFARDERCHPAALEAFQRFNLENVRENGRVVRSRPGLAKSMGAAYRMWRLGLRLGTITSAAGQLAREVRDRRYAYRRAVFQGRIAFDLFERAWTQKRPDFSTFFTNHVAGLQHRYWQARYPEDYGADDVKLDPFFAEAIDYGMAVADHQVGRLMRLAETGDAILVVASSMGQEAVHKHTSTTMDSELQVASEKRLAAFVGYEGPLSRNLAMAPQVAFDFTDAQDLDRFHQGLTRVQDPDGHAVFRLSKSGMSLSVTIRTTPAALAQGRVQFRNGQAPRTATLEEAGFEIVKPDSPGTAYHMPEGILLFWGAGIPPDAARTRVSTVDFVPTVLDLYGLPRPPHLMGRSFASRLRPASPAGDMERQHSPMARTA